MRIFFTKLLLSKNTEKKELAIISFIIPKGLATAVLADIPLHMHFPNYSDEYWLKIRSLAYAVILFSLIISSVISQLTSAPNRHSSILI